MATVFWLSMGYNFGCLIANDTLFDFTLTCLLFVSEYLILFLRIFFSCCPPFVALNSYNVLMCVKKLLTHSLTR